ncbi:ParB/RepB/Spo0J family partition protein [Klebsiella sp. BIGb0407]|uniref:ParB/RepB/Spo0J family partition protein n=1 Tax=Klebsiella sp. BIGb0407 TaxID=2940603 RepID=UPI0021694E7A|nr:ParB/RepB/Spo0J family partition protein [Klebsiella sp. BIGb0407]MCS3434326.1 ParB family chromosome partitioning protein [Klebsiella sp. BIGb0407]
MSVKESKAKTAKKATRKDDIPAVSVELESVLDAAEVRMTSFSRLFIGELNSRLIPHTPEEIQGYADSIQAVGLLQNLVVVEREDGRLEVVCGGGRTKAIGLLVEAGQVDPDKEWIVYKAVPLHLARAASMTENGKRKSMHPAEQIIGFRSMSVDGNTPAEIGGLLGYSARHVQRMLKLANLAPELLTLLAENKLDVEQCQALSLEPDQARQVEVYTRARESYNHIPAHLLKRMITETEISVTAPRFVFVGREAYEAAGGAVREDLFSAEEGDGTADSVLTDRLVQEKLVSVAQTLEQEGWSWSLVRDVSIKNYGEDRANYLLLPEPEAQYSADEQLRLDELYATQEAAETVDDEAALQVFIDEIEQAALIRAWMPETKASCGVVVCWEHNELCIQRGVQKKVQDASAEGQDNSELHIITRSTPDVAEGISLPLLKKMSSERTLAVQAALIQQPQKAVALMVWRLCSCVFDYSTSASHPFELRLEVHHGELTSEAPTGKEGQAWQLLMEEKSRLEALLPEGWKRDFTTFFSLDGQTLLSLMTFCTACSVNGVQSRECGHTRQSKLDGVEAALGFHLRDWWQPTAENFLGLLSKKQIAEALSDAGLTGAASDAEKMKRGDAASHAEQWLSGTRWVPGWMHSPKTEKPEVGNTTTDSDHSAPHAA